MFAFIPANFVQSKCPLESSRESRCIRPIIWRFCVLDDRHDAHSSDELRVFQCCAAYFPMCVTAHPRQDRNKLPYNRYIDLGSRSFSRKLDSRYAGFIRNKSCEMKGRNEILRDSGSLVREEMLNKRNSGPPSPTEANLKSSSFGQKHLERVENQGRSLDTKKTDVSKQGFHGSNKSGRHRQKPDYHFNAPRTLKSNSRFQDRLTSLDSGPGIASGGQLQYPGRRRGGYLARNSGIDILISGTESQSGKILRDLAACKIPLTISEFNEVLSTLCRQRKLRTAMGLVHVAEASPFARQIGPRLNIKSYTIMLDIFGKSRQLSRAFDLFYKMQRHGIEPNVVTYNALISGCSRNNEPDLALEIFEEMQYCGLQPDKFTYASLIDSRAKTGDVESAFEIAELMDRNGVAKDQTIYSALMEACSRAQQLERALLVYEKMKRKGIWPNLVTFAVLLDCCANAREPYKAFEIFAEIKHWDLEPNVVAYTALIDCCGKAGWPERAALVFDEMVLRSIRPNEITYGALIEAWTHNGRLEKAFETLEKMTLQNKVLPNSILIGGLIDACRKSQDGSYVSQIWNLIMRHNIRPSKCYYPTLIALSAHASDVETSIAVAGHCYARGLFRRSSHHSEDPVLRSLAFSMIYLRRIVRKIDDGKIRRTRIERLQLIWDSMPMTEAEADAIRCSDAVVRASALAEAVYDVESAGRNTLRSSLAAWRATRASLHQGYIGNSLQNRTADDSIDVT